MSGPFPCSTCDATGQVITGWDDDGEETLRTCYECKGSGETWFFITDPNRPNGWPDEPPAFNLNQTIRKAIAEAQPRMVAHKVIPLCEDCPPADYPTDKTRCERCPRRPENKDKF